MTEPVVSVCDLKTHFLVDKAKKAYVRAVDGVSFNIEEGEIVGLVGESGSGKSTIAYTIMGIEKPTSGEILFRGENIIAKLDKKRPLHFKQQAQIIFQDPGSSLNPYQDVMQILTLPLLVHKVVPKKNVEEKILEILEMVELPSDFLYKSPNSISGGEKQLVSIARALCCNPNFVILDEPTSSLDVSIQAKIINMLLKLKNERKLTYLFITHDLSLIRNISTKVIIMYLGKICEIAPTVEFYNKPLHPYTQMLLSSIPVISEAEEDLKPKKIVSVGEIPSPVNIPKGCSFNTRCNRVMDICKDVDPPMIDVGGNHVVRCHLFNDRIET